MKRTSDSNQFLFLCDFHTSDMMQKRANKVQNGENFIQKGIFFELI